MNKSAINKNTEYRSDIDGLRAIAVLSVLFNHVEVPFFQGGFVGVDIFFVISGFLITRLILVEIEASGKFSFSNFYVRRSRRLLPVLFVTLLLCYLFAFLLFSDEQFNYFTNSFSAAVLSVSNFYFWNTVGYFDLDASLKPLLHLWSLAVEEQFYLFWPLFLVVIIKIKKSLPVVLIVIGGVSFFLNWVIIQTQLVHNLALPAYVTSLLSAGQETAFYMLPFRVFEFVIGGLMVWATKRQPAPNSVREISLAVGLIIIAYSVLTLNDQSIFPFYNALLPCIGAAFVIWGGTSRYLGMILRNLFTAQIGLISYSLYLVHWPIIVFWKSWTLRALTLEEQVMVVCASMTLAYIFYKFIEQPFRNQGQISNKRLAKSPTFLVGVTFLALLTSGLGYISPRFFDSRIPEERITKTNSEWRSLQLRNYCMTFAPDMPRDLLTCQNFRNSDRDIFIWGDSHALHLVGGMSATFPNYNIYIAYSTGCTPQNGFGNYVRSLNGREDLQAKCIERNKAMMAFLSDYKPTNVILTSAKRGSPDVVANSSNIIIRKLKNRGHNVLLLGDFIRPGNNISLCASVPRYLISNEAIERRCVPDQSRVERELAYNETIEQLVPEFIQVRDVQCPNNTCNFFMKNGQSTHRDHHHLSPDGSIYWLSQLKKRLNFQ